MGCRILIAYKNIGVKRFIICSRQRIRKKSNMNGVLTVTLILAFINAVTGRPFNAVVDNDYRRYAGNALNKPVSKDNKMKREIRDKLNPGYTLTELDGSIKIVENSTNDPTGFNAVVYKNVYNLLTTQLQEPLVLPPNSDIISGYLNYGFSAIPKFSAVPKVTLSGISLPWDSITGSFGGWVPLDNGPHATIIRKKYINGKLHKLIIGPISLAGQSIVIRKSKLSED